ncbi:sensor histidine kinase [Chryseobacterium indologenes]|uniref:sensor histidine kinase n=1 Tax=Chryseobacterium indologenes TaxID=253 RepID=UPI000F4E13AB|nr:HAMP domain-containing sensor histidine kinase [Chryseobacterium indologenes]AYZ37422.1 sensor histidine kinase [Chryseobacterium indologenes]MBF6646291.1 HAMP domain-containing histidine kinase [Chryseobacterium indologenes]MBU3046638.1 HAMP domain-containing histidine kinase [Chryseobacterium indologenes]MEB4761763.1 HAMP domain-containing sensor histidine kinase [Chryseobacterium indologenes]QQQ70036.1 HAMP domain-containing histidine kinase [Chryseobacterium indologenes]
MTLRNRFTLISSLSFGIVSIITSAVIFFAYYDSTKIFYFEKLRNTALISAIYYLEKDELPKDRHAQIKKEYNHLIQNNRVAVYNRNNEVTFGHNLNDKNIKPIHLQTVRKNKGVEFMSDNQFYYGIFYPDNQGDFVVFVKSPNDSFQSQIWRLSIIMLSVLVLGLLAIFFLSRYLSKIVYKPISNVVERINKVEFNNISTAITSTNTNDEIEDLIKSYNKLLGRISENVLLQQNFINYVSHEFKTPLAAISGNLEVFAQRDRTPEEYREVAKESLENVYEIENILNNLLLMSGMTKLESSHKQVRVDELIWKIYEKLECKAKENNSSIKIQLEVSKPSLLEFPGNETLLYLALYNIVENGIKYSKDHPVTIILSEKYNQLNIEVKDQGKGIPKEDLDKITETFYRGKNVDNIKGSGIGLSLSRSIFDLHHITMKIDSKINMGTSVLLIFPSNC